MSKVSFLVTYYNQERYVSQSLDSILAIDFPDNCSYEILIGDDGSVDGTQKEVQKYIDKYPDKIKMFVMPREQGKKYNSILRASSNRLNLLSKVTGDYYCIFDGDDWYCDKTWIRDALQIMNYNKSISVCAFRFQCVTNEKSEPVISNLSEGKISAKKYLFGEYIHAGCCLFRYFYKPNDIEVMKKIGYFDDNNILIANLNYGDMYFINRVIYSYRQTGVSIWTSISNFEQNVINALDYDVNKKYGSKYPEEIKQRHLDALRFVLKNRSRYYKVLGKEKAEKYLSMSQSIEDSLSYKILNFDSLKNNEKKEIFRFLRVSPHRKIKKFVLRIIHIFKKIGAK